MSRVLSARAAIQLLFRRKILGHQGPKLFDSGGAGGAGRDQVVKRLRGEQGQIVAHQGLEGGGGVAAGQGGNAAAALLQAAPGAPPRGASGADAPPRPPGDRACRRGSRQKRRPSGREPRPRGLQATHLAVPGDRGQGLEAPVLEQRRHEAGAGGPQEIVHPV